MVWLTTTTTTTTTLINGNIKSRGFTVSQSFEMFDGGSLGSPESKLLPKIFASKTFQVKIADQRCPPHRRLGHGEAYKFIEKVYFT
jgi:hypothetical protein